MSAILEQLKAERNEIAKAIRVVLDDGTAPDNLVEHVRFLMLEEYDPIVKRNDELKGGIAALRERVKVLEEAAAKLVNCHEQDDDGCVHAKDINVAVYDVPRKFDRDKALEDLAFILGAAALRGEA